MLHVNGTKGMRSYRLHIYTSGEHLRRRLMRRDPRYQIQTGELGWCSGNTRIVKLTLAIDNMNTCCQT